MAEDVPIVQEDDDQLAKRKIQAIPLEKSPADIPPPAIAMPASQAPVLPAPQVARPELVNKSGQAIPVGRHAAIPGYVNPDTNGEPGLFNPPHPVGVAQLASKAENINNPFLRALAKVGAVGARALDTAGSIVAPGVAAAIPGTTQNQAVKIGGEQKREAQQTKEGLEKAQTGEATAKAGEANRADPKLGAPEEQAFAYLLTQNDPATNKPYTPMAAFSAAQQAKQDVKPVPEGQQPVSDANQINQINAERAQQWHVMHPDQPLDGSYMAKVGDTKDSIKEQDERFGRLGTAEGTAAQREATKTQRDQAEADRKANQAEGEANRKSQQGTALKEKAITYWQPALDSAERVNVMAKNYREGVDNHNQQAMLSLLSNHLGMTMGLQKGARLNQALITEAQKSAPWFRAWRPNSTRTAISPASP